MRALLATASFVRPEKGGFEQIAVFCTKEFVTGFGLDCAAAELHGIAGFSEYLATFPPIWSEFFPERLINIEILLFSFKVLARSVRRCHQPEEKVLLSGKAALQLNLLALVGKERVRQRDGFFLELHLLHSLVVGMMSVPYWLWWRVSLRGKARRSYSVPW